MSTPQKPASSRPFQFRKPGTAAAAATLSPPVFKNVVQKTNTTLEFQLNPTDVTYANALRRVMLTEVETVGFRADIGTDGATADVKILKNSTAMSNEMLAHRIGLLPVFVPNPLEWNPDAFQFKLTVSNDGGDPRDVVAADITVLKNRGPEEDPLPVPSTEFFRPDPISQDTCLLAVLRGKMTNQEAETVVAEMKATVGIGRENARFIPVSQCAYKYTPDTDPERRKTFFEEWLQSHKKVNPADLESNATRKKELENEFATMEIQRCFLVDGNGEPYSFDFVVESVGVLSPTYIVARALQVLQEKVVRYASIETGDLPENIDISPADARMKGFDFLFRAEDHTLGTILQTWIDKNLMDTAAVTTAREDGGAERSAIGGAVSYVGYKVPHPLRDEMVLRVGVEDGKESTARDVVARAARGLAEQFKRWGAEWAAAAGTSGAAPAPTVRYAMEQAQAQRTPRF